MRKSFKDQEIGLDPYFRYRGKNQTRIETFSDAAFALAITLMVLSSSVPTTFNELWHSLQDIIPFGLCITLLSVIWYQHYRFFLLYGLQNTTVVVLNTVLLFLILVYVYPLKFLFRVLVQIYSGLITGDHGMIGDVFKNTIAPEDTRILMIIYGIGIALIFITMAYFYRHALSKKEELLLNDYELFITKNNMRENILMAAVPLLSVLVASLGIFGKFNFTISGFVYMLYPPVMILHEKYYAKKKRVLIQDLETNKKIGFK